MTFTLGLGLKIRALEIKEDGPHCRQRLKLWAQWVFHRTGPRLISNLSTSFPRLFFPLEEKNS